MTVLSSNDLYAALIGRILDYVPSGANAEMPAVSLRTGALGSRCWVLQAPDSPTFPYVTLRIASRRPKGDYGLVQGFAVEIDVWNRPRDKAHAQAVQAIADQIEAALAEYAEPTTGAFVTGVELRDTIFYASSPADRDVLREMMRFSGILSVPYLALDIGTS